MKVYVSTILEKDHKFLLVREAKKQCYEKWNFPSGHLEYNEYIIDAAIREVKEETNLDVKLNGLVSIYNNMFEGSNSIAFVFTSQLNNSENNSSFSSSEILETKWFSFDEIKSMQGQLRDPDYVITSLEKYISNNVMPLNVLIQR